MSSPASSPTPFPRPADAQPGDVLSLAFADERAGVYGCGRLQVDERTAQAHSIVVVFAEARPIAMMAGAASVQPDSRDAGTIDGGGLTLRDDGGEWAARFAGGSDGVGGFTVRCTARHPWLAARSDHGERRVQRVDLEGEVQTAAGPLALAASGQLTFSRGLLPTGAAVTRELAIWVGERLAVDVTAVRERSGDGHDAESLQAVLIEDDPACLQVIELPRLSTTYDADGRPLRAGLELWLSEESGYARRVAGEALCAATLATDTGRWDCTFLRWHIEGDAGIGPYLLWRAATGRR